MLLSLLAMLALSHPAHAIHGYHSDWCHQKAGSLQLRANHDWAEATPKGAEQGSDASVTGAIAEAGKALEPGEEFHVLKTKITNAKSKPYDDGCWTGTEGSYSAVLVIERVAPKAAAIGLSPGMQIPVDCTTEDIDPDGPSC